MWEGRWDLLEVWAYTCACASQSIVNHLSHNALIFPWWLGSPLHGANVNNRFNCVNFKMVVFGAIFFKTMMSYGLNIDRYLLSTVLSSSWKSYCVQINDFSTFWMGEGPSKHHRVVHHSGWRAIDCDLWCLYLVMDMALDLGMNVNMAMGRDMWLGMGLSLNMNRDWMRLRLVWALPWHWFATFHKSRNLLTIWAAHITVVSWMDTAEVRLWTILVIRTLATKHLYSSILNQWFTIITDWNNERVY